MIDERRYFGLNRGEQRFETELRQRGKDSTKRTKTRLDITFRKSLVGLRTVGV